MVEDAKWQDGEPVTADDVKFTIEAIMDPENGSENAPNYEDVEEINVLDDHTAEFKYSISSSDHFIAGYYGKGKCCQSFYCNWSDQLDKYRKGNTYRGPTDTKQ